MKIIGRIKEVISRTIFKLSMDRSGAVSPKRQFITITAGVFFAEVIAMIVVFLIKPLPYYLTTLIDAGIMIVLILPILYLFSFHPLIQQIEKLQQAEENLHRAYEELELRVLERTEELRVANSELEGEILVRRRAEEALQESEQRLKRSQEIAHLGSWELDLIKNQLTWSDEVYRIFGLEPQEFDATYEAFLEAVHPDDRAAVDEAYLGSVREGRNSYEIEHRVVRRSDGEIRIVHEKCEHFRNEADKIVRSVGMVHDITSRKKAEEVLQRFQLLSEHSRDIILFMRFPDGHILEANTAAIQAYGYSHDELLALTITDLQAANAKSLTAEQMAQANVGGLLFETIHHRKDGSCFPVEVSSQGATIGGVRTLVSIIRDITERRKAEEQLERGNQKLNEILTSIQDDFYVLDRNWNFVYTSRLFAEKAGKKPEDFVGDNIWTVFPKHVGTSLEENFRATMEKREVQRFEIRGLYTDAWYRMTVFPSTEGITVLGTDITKRKAAEEALHQIQLDLYRAQEVGQIGSWRLDVRMNKLTWSDENYRIFGIPRGTQLTYQTFLSTIHPDDLEFVDTSWNAALGGESYDIEHRIIVDGKIKWVREKAFLEYDQENVLRGGFGITQDITVRKQAEDALRESESKYRNLFENMTEEVHFWQLVRDEAGQIVTWRLVDANPPTLKTWGRNSVDEIRGKTTDEIFGPGARDHYLPIVQKIMTEGVSYSYEDYFPNLDKYFRFTSVPLEEYFITTGADITTIKKAERALRAAHNELELRVQERTEELAAANLVLSNEIIERREVERQLRIQTTAMEAAADGIVITDPQGFILWMNPALIRMSGYQKDELVGQNMRLFKSGLHDEDYYREIWTSILAGQMWKGETINRRRDGCFYVEEQTIAPVPGEDGKISHFIAIKHDITEQKQAKAELERRNLELQVLSQTERKQRQLAETLRISAQALTQSLDLDLVIRTLLKHLRMIVQADTASAIFSEGENYLGVRAVDGYEKWTDPANLLDIKIESDTNPLFQKLLATRETLVIPETADDPDWEVYPGTEPIHSRVYVPVIVEDRLIGVIGLGKLEPGYFTEEHIRWAETLVGQAAVAIQNAWLFEQVRAGRERLQFLSRRLVEIQESERHYIARELHDHAGQNLTSLMLGLGAMEKEACNPEFIRTRAAELKAMADHILEDLHRLAINLRPASLDHLGLTAALEQLIKSFTQDSHLPIRLKAVGFSEDERLPHEIETALYRIVQEALTNVVRHAKASHVDVVLESRDDSMLVIVEDDGQGFDIHLARNGGHLGLLGMQERTEMLGGTLTIESTPEMGTTLFVEVPYVHPNIARR